VSHQLIGFFVAAIQLNWVVDGSALRMQAKAVASIDRTAGNAYTRCSMPVVRPARRIEKSATTLLFTSRPAGFQLSSANRARLGRQMDHPRFQIPPSENSSEMAAVSSQGQPAGSESSLSASSRCKPFAASWRGRVSLLPGLSRPITPIARARSLSATAAP